MSSEDSLNSTETYASCRYEDGNGGLEDGIVINWDEGIFGGGGIFRYFSWSHLRTLSSHEPMMI